MKNLNQQINKILKSTQHAFMMEYVFEKEWRELFLQPPQAEHPCGVL